MRDIDLLWVLICTALILLMQAGFLCIESGAVRQKNSVNVATKNILDLSLSGVLFWLVGYSLAMGTSLGGWIGWGNPATGSTSQVQLLFLLMFCGTTATIISGAIAERATLAGYLLMTAVTSTLLFPVVAHWVWNEGGWLARSGFVDFAGSTVVHMTGGILALIACMIVGPRRGRKHARMTTPANNLTLSALGTLLVWVGWLGFNGGSLMQFGDAVPRVLLNTSLAGMAGACWLTLTARLHSAPLRFENVLVAVIASLVGITASAHAISAGGAMGIGVLCAATAKTTMDWIARRGIDDVVGVVSAHGAAGALGTLLVPLYADLAVLGTGLSRLEQFQVQLLGVIACAAFVGICGLACFTLCNRWVPFRCTPEAEQTGLDISEHAASNAWLELGNHLKAATVTTGRNAPQSAVSSFDSNTPEGQIYAGVSNLALTAETAKQESLRAIQGKDRADAANAAKSAFLANMSHELRTPLNGVLGTLEIALGEDLSSATAENLKIAKSSSEHLLTLLNDLLDTAKFEAGEVSLELRPVHLRDLIKEALATLSQVANGKGIALDYEVAPLVPTYVQADPTRLRQVLLNLIGNAIKFTEHGGVQVTAHCERSATTEDCVLQVEIADTGIGIPQEALATVFERFKQADTSTTRLYGGTGLGLGLCKDLIELMGGEISATSKVGAGTTFSFSLPTTAVHRHEELPTAVAEQQTPEFSNLRLLIAEDNPTNQIVVRRMLETLGVTKVDLVSDGQQAIAQWSSGRYDLIFMDCQMPVLDGIDAARQIRTLEQDQNLPPTPIIALTANASVTDRDACIAAGMSDHVSKPLQLAALRAALAVAAKSDHPDQGPTNANA